MKCLWIKHLDGRVFMRRVEDEVEIDLDETSKRLTIKEFDQLGVKRYELDRVLRAVILNEGEDPGEEYF